MTRSLHAAGPGRSRGQATVETAVGLPFVFFTVLLALQLALVGRDAILVSHAAREGARAAAVEPTPSAARDGARAASTALDPRRLDVDLDRSGDRVTVTVQYRSLTRLPAVGRLLPDVTVSSSATMLVELG